MGFTVNHTCFSPILITSLIIVRIIGKETRGVTIHLPYDTIRIVILTSRYDTYHDTFNQTDRLTHTQPGHTISLFSY